MSTTLDERDITREHLKDKGESAWDVKDKFITRLMDHVDQSEAELYKEQEARRAETRQWVKSQNEVGQHKKKLADLLPVLIEARNALSGFVVGVAEIVDCSADVDVLNRLDAAIQSYLEAQK